MKSAKFLDIFLFLLNKNTGMDMENDIDVSDIEILKSKKARLNNLCEKYKFNLSHCIVVCLVFTIAGYLFPLVENDCDILTREYFVHNIRMAFLGGISGIFMYLYIIFLFGMMHRNSLRRVEMQLVQLGAIDLQENIDEDFFTKLIQINFKYLDQYYLQTKEQADKSFALARITSIAGFIVIIVGVVAMTFFSLETPAYITAGSGVIAEFISSIFFYLYNRTIIKMSQYHEKLLISQNLGLALKLSESFDTDAKMKVQEMIIDRLTTDVNRFLTIKYQSEEC